jgi:hypothetical protein
VSEPHTIARVTVAEARAYWERRNAIRLCPSCRGPMTRERGTIHTDHFMRDATIQKIARLAAFWACPTCEHCEE